MLHDADGGPSRSVCGVVDVVATAAHGASAGSGLNAQHITGHIAVQRHRDAAAAEGRARGIEVGIAYRAATEQGDRRGAAAHTRLLQRRWIGVGAGEHRRVVGSRHVDAARNDNAGGRTQGVRVGIGRAEADRARQGVGAAVGVRVVRTVGVGHRPQNRLVIFFGVSAAQRQYPVDVTRHRDVGTACLRTNGGARHRQHVARVAVLRDGYRGAVHLRVVRVAQSQSAVDRHRIGIFKISQGAAWQCDHRQIIGRRQVDRLGRRARGGSRRIRVCVGQAVGQRARGLAGVSGRVIGAVEVGQRAQHRLVIGDGVEPG